MNASERQGLLELLQARFMKHVQRHRAVSWTDVLARLEGKPALLKSLLAMELTGGEPDVIAQDGRTGAMTFCDCSAQSPVGRRSLCYDRKAQDSRKEHKPKSNAVETASAMGVDLLTEEQYRQLQNLGEFDTKTSSWIQTTPDVRALGGALFCDRRYDKVFVYHNGAESYYAARGFRGSIQA